MKKFIILLSAVAFFASCQKAIETSSTPDAEVSKVPMVLESVITKTVLASDGLSIHWEAGDVISVFDNNNNNEKFTTTDAGAVARFEGSVLSTASDFYAMVPYRTTNTSFDYANRTLRTYLVTGQKGSINSFENKRMISVAKVDVENAKVSFTNICGLLKFTLSRNDVKEVKFTSKGGKNLGRSVDITFAEDGTIASIAAFEDSKGAEITMTHPEGNFPAGTYYALALPNNHSEGLAITVTLADGSTLTIDNTSVLEIPRNQKVNLGTIDEGFAVLPANKTISAGASVNFATGSYETAELWSGEKYHDYTYAVEGRTGYPDYYMSFGTVNQVSTTTIDTTPLYVKYSTDFDGEYSYTRHVSSATWVDISSNFNFDDDFTVTSASYNVDDAYTASGEYNIESCFNDGTTTYIAFCYDIDKAAKTIVYLKNFKVEKSVNGVRETVYEMKAYAASENAEGCNIYYVNGSNTALEDNYSKFYKSSTDLGYYDVLKFSCRGAYATGRQHGYAIAQITREPLAEPVCDTPSANSTAAAISHTYASAGQYPVVIVSKKGTKTFICKASLNVVE